MQTSVIRQKFIEFFEKRGHIKMPAASLIPTDPSVLFTTAGMQQFKPWFIDSTLAKYKRVVTIQPCFRTSDIEEVGDATHLTYFQMLGNFSFGDPARNATQSVAGGYGKKEAIKLAWEFVNKKLEIDISRISVSVLKSVAIFSDVEDIDRESYNAWLEIGIPKEKIKFGNIEDNFWGPTGSNGPCGPTSEIYIDDVEVWNIVFNQFISKTTRDEALRNGWKVEDIPLGIDTGMGLERIATVINGFDNVFETDELKTILDRVPDGDIRSRRIIVDHVRAINGLIKDGVMPSNKSQGAVLRRLIRRAFTHGRLIGADDGLLVGFAEGHSRTVVSQELEKFSQTLKQAMGIYSRILEKTRIDKRDKLSSEDAFLMQESYGLPLELLEELARKDGLSVDKKGFEKLMQEHRQKSRAGVEGKFKGGLVEVTPETTKLHTAHHLLLAALRQVLGDHVVQRGSNITGERLRIDVSHQETINNQQLTEIENLVNEWIQKDLKVTHEEMPLQEAYKKGALGEFGATYPEKVNVYSIGNVSMEICGGPHVTRTGEIKGTFKIAKQESSGAGVRRIKGVLE